jgi:hypothetical protein
VIINTFWRVLLISILILVPCFWHSRIQAGDLSSHIYNAWLALELEHNPVPGLSIAAQSTNVLFDSVLSALIPRVGVDAAQKIAVSSCVLIFFWGSFLFVRSASGTDPWRLVPCIAMLTYGWVFHAGFFNFYLSLGICLFALALAWNHRPVQLALAAGLLPVAWIAHSLPVLWSIALFAGMALARAFPRYFFGAGVVVLIAVRWLAEALHPVAWSWKQIFNVTGADQFVVFGFPFAVLAVVMLLLWLTMVINRLKSEGFTPELKLLAVLAVALIVFPNAAQFENENVALGFVPHRLSLTVALLVCVVIAKESAVAWQQALLWLLMISYGTLLFIDTGNLDAQETRLVKALKTQSGSPRVVLAAAHPPSSRANMFPHMIDRACIDLCFSYANYEPSTLAFRIRATARNPIVAFNYDDSLAMQSGEYLVLPEDLPLLQVNFCPEPVIQSLKAGDIAGQVQCPPR